MRRTLISFGRCHTAVDNLEASGELVRKIKTVGHDHEGGAFSTLKRGESALVPASAGPYRMACTSADVEVVRVTLPY